MADKITDKQVADLIAALRTDASLDSKVALVNAIKSSIKQHNVPDTCVAPLFDALRTASSSQHAALVNAGFTSLNHLLTRLSRQEPKYLSKEAARTLPLIVEKLGDQKEKFRSTALQSLITLYAVAPQDVERFVRNTAMGGKNPRAKEMALQWLLQMHQESGLQFRSYVPTLMELLEDADGMVRDAAKSTVIELFRNAPNGAKSDLKKQLKNFKVRPAIEQAIVKELVPTSATSSAPPSQQEHLDEPARPTRGLAASVSSLGSERPITPMSDTRPEQVEPTYVNTQRELDEIFREMQFHFEGKETEQNWLKREESVVKLRRLMAGNASTDFHDSFLSGVRALLDGLIKAINSLRTSLSKEGCNLVQDLARTFGPGIDPMVELLMQTFIKLSAATKKIASQQANVTVDTILGRVTYSNRLMQHVWGACQDKNVQPRLYATGWLKTLLTKEAHHKNHVEHSGGLDLVEKCIKKGLADPNPGVREKMRATYWCFAGIWPAKAEAIMNGLDAQAQKLLEKDPNNPNSPKKAEGAARPGLGLSKSTMGTSKPSLRETMLAQKKAAMATKNLPVRPGSAMSHFSPVRTASSTSQASAASTATASTTATVRTRPESTLGGISGAPMRPTRRRPEMAARPATAGPYSVRSHDQPSTEQSSPNSNSNRTKAVTPKTVTDSPKRSVTRRPCHMAHASEGSLPTPSKIATVKAISSPRTTPSKMPTPKSTTPRVRPVQPAAASSPSKSLEDLTMVTVPTLLNARSSPPSQGASLSPVPPSPAPASPTPPPSIEVVPAEVPIEVEVASTRAETPIEPVKVYEDPFTGEQPTPKPTFAAPVLEDKPVNEDAAIQQRTEPDVENGVPGLFSPEKAKQNTRLLDSGISKVKAQSLDVHGFRKLQGIIRDSKSGFSDDKFDALLSGLFEFLESPLTHISPEKVQDVKAQILATIKLLLKKMRDSFQPHVSRGLESLLRARAGYDGRTHIVSGLELLAAELVTLGDPSEMTLVLSKMLGNMEADSAATRSLSMGLHTLKEMVEMRKDFMPSSTELDILAALTGRCLESTDSGVRMDSVQLCVALHERVGEQRFWEAMRGVREDPKSLITYYVVKKQREKEGGGFGLVG